MYMEPINTQEQRKPIRVHYPINNQELLSNKQYQEELDKITEKTFLDAGTIRTIKNIKETLVDVIRRKYNKTNGELKNIVDSFLKIHGLHEDNFDFMASFSKFITNKLNDISIDENANKGAVSIKGNLKEVELSVDKLIGYDMLYRTIKDLYGQEEAKKLSAKMYDYSLALADSSNILLPYCWAMDASKIVTIGRDFGVLPSKPAKRVSSYISALCETIHQLSNHLAGACLYKDSNLLLDNGNQKYLKNIKELINETPLINKYSNYQGDWEYADISNKNIKIIENGRFIKINKVMRRKYDDDIYIIKTKSGKTVKCSKDHIFKVLYKGRDLEIKAKDLRISDTVYNTALVTDLPINKNSKDYKRGQFIGLIVGDGNITNSPSIRMAVNYDQNFINDFLTKYVKETYNKDIQISKGNGCWETRIPNSTDHYKDPTCNIIYEDIRKDIIGDNAENKNINIKNKSIDYLVGFLDGYLTADGTYDNSLRIGSINKDLIILCKTICSNLGIATSENIHIYLDKRSNRKPFHSIGINLKLLKYLDLMSKKVQNSNNFIKKNRNFSTLETKETAYYGAYAFTGSTSFSLKSNQIAKTYKPSSIAKLHNPITDVIISIEKFKNDDEYVYEIETESHWYSINGILTHNCAVGSFFLDITHLLIYKERISLNDLKNNSKKRKYLENEFQQFIHSVNHLSRNSVESPFTNVSIFDKEKLKALISAENYGWYFPNKIEVRVDNNLGGEEYKLSDKDFKEFILDYIFETQKIYVELFDKGDPLNGGMPYRFPVTTINLSKHKDEQGKFYLDQDNELFNYIVKKDISKYNIFTSEGTKVASCCRLINNKEMLDMAASVNSFGGSNVSLGSHRVITINLTRIALETQNYEEYKQILDRRIEYCAKILKAHRLLIIKLADKGLQPFIKNGWINMNRMFSTYGLIGIVEANRILKQNNDQNFDYIEDILKFINEKCKEYSAKYEFIYNIEQIPGESMAVRLAKADKILFGDKFDIPELYSNQNVPLWEDATIYEKMDADGKYNQLYTGGGICHIQISSNITSTQAKNIINYAVKSGCEHFALNAVYSKCKKCGTVYKAKLTTCPDCKHDKLDYFTRVVGFFTPVKDWNTIRRDWEFDKRKFTDLKTMNKEIK